MSVVEEYIITDFRSRLLHSYVVSIGGIRVA